MRQVEVGIGPITEDELVAVARGDAGVKLAPAALDGDHGQPHDRRGPRRRRRAALRHLDRLRRAGHEAHSGRRPHALAAVADPLACGRVGYAGRARGRARDDAAAPVDARDRTHRRARLDRARLRRAADRGHHAGRARVRIARLFGRSRPARPRRADADRRRVRERPGRRRRPLGDACSPPPDWHRSRWPRKRASR